MGVFPAKNPQVLFVRNPTVLPLILYSTLPIVPRLCRVVMHSLVKRHRAVPRSVLERKGRLASLARFLPVVEVTPLIRPRLLLVASNASSQVMLGVLYHTRKDMWQTRLRVRSSGLRTFSQRSRWKKYADAQAFLTWRQRVVRDFANLAVTLGATATLHLEFSPLASNDEILQALSDLLLSLFP